MLSIAAEAETVELPLDPGALPPAPRARARRPQLSATDAHRLTLQAKLTEIGVPLHPGDRGALRQLAALDTESVDAVVRWLSCAEGVPCPSDGTFLTDAPPRPADLVDPRLIAW